MSIITEALKRAQKDRFVEVRKEVPKKEVSSLSDIYKPSASITKKKEERTKKNSKSLLIVYLLVFGVVIALSVLIFMWTINSEVAPLDQPVNKSVPQIESTRKIVESIQNNITKQIPSVRKPVTVETVLPVVNGIMFSADNPTAIINDNIVSSGDIISGYRIEEIFPDYVEVSDSKGTYKLKLK